MYKNFLILLLTFVFLISFTSAAISDDLVSHYKFDQLSGVVLDSQGLNNGTNTGATRGVSGKIDNAFDFNGANQYVTVPFSSTFDTNGMTGYSAFVWVYIDNVTGTKNLFRNIYSSSYDGIYLGIIDTNPYVEYRTGATTNNRYFIQDLNYNFSTGQWYNFGFTWTSGNLSYYVNGQYINSTGTATSSGIADRDNDLYFAIDQGLDGDYDGKLDELRIYNRTLTLSEVSEIGLGDQLNVQLILPNNNSQTSDDPLNFTANLMPGYNLSNATLTLWFNNGTFWRNETNTTISGNNSQNVTFYVENMTAGTFYWNVFGVQGNGNTTNSTYALNNYTFSWIPFTINNQVYNTSSLETESQDFLINITTLSAVQNVGVFLNYNGTDYAADSSCSAGLCEISRTIDIPLLSSNSATSENKSFFWKITLFGSFGTLTFNTSEIEQNVSNVLFTNSASGNDLSVNYTIHNESTRDYVVANFDSAFEYWLGSGTVMKIFNFSSSGANTYPFYVNRERKYYVNSNIQIYNGSNVRNYQFVNQEYNNETTDIELFLRDSDSTAIIIDVKDEGLVPLSGITVNISRYYEEIGGYKQIESKVTDEFGQIVAYLIENDEKYKFSFYDSNNRLLKTSQDLTIACRSTICILPFIIESQQNIFDQYNNLSLLTYEFTFNNATNQFIFSWDDQRNEQATYRLEVRRYTLNDSSIVCNSTSISTVASMTCNVGSTTASYQAQVFRTVNGVETRIALLNVKVGDTSQIYGKEGLFWVFILLMTSIGIGLYDPKVAAAIYGVGFVIMGIMGIISMPLTVFFANSLIVIIFIWAVRT